MMLLRIRLPFLFVAIQTCLYAFNMPDSIKKHFNRAMTAHLKGIGYALAKKERYPDVDPQRGLACFWETIALNGGAEALMNDLNVYELALEFHEIAKNRDTFLQAAQSLKALNDAHADAATIDLARFRLHVAYIGGVAREAHKRGCDFRRPDCAPTLAELQPNIGGTFPATDEKNWGSIAYLASLMQANAHLDVMSNSDILKAFALAQLIFRAEELAA